MARQLGRFRKGGDMKKLSITLCALCLLALLVLGIWANHSQARTVMVVTGGVAASTESCSAAAEQSLANTGDYENIANAAEKKYFGPMFTASSAYKVCKIAVDLKKTGTPTPDITYTVKIYDNNSDPSDRPGSVVASSTSADASAAALTTSYQLIYFDFNNYQLTNGAKYWIVIVSSGYDATNYIRTQSGSTAGLRAAYGADGATWNTADIDFNYAIYAYK
jgi:hypothetical protein